MNVETMSEWPLYSRETFCVHARLQPASHSHHVGMWYVTIIVNDATFSHTL